MLVEDCRNPTHRRREPSERGRSVAVQVEHIDSLAINDAQQRAERQRIEFRALQIGEIDALPLERFFRQILLAQADERDGEPAAIEPRNHPGEQTFDAVHSRAFPAEVVAHLEHVQHAIGHLCGEASLL